MWCFVYVNTSGWVLVAHCVGLLSISTVAAHSGEGEGCWDVPQEWVQLLPTAQSPGGGCGEASRGAGEATTPSRTSSAVGLQGEQAACPQPAWTEVGGMEGWREAGMASWGAQRNRRSVIPGRKLQSWPKPLQKARVQWAEERFVYKPFYFCSFSPSHSECFSIYEVFIS